MVCPPFRSCFSLAWLFLIPFVSYSVYSPRALLAGIAKVVLYLYLPLASVLLSET